MRYILISGIGAGLFVLGLCIMGMAVIEHNWGQPFGNQWLIRWSQTRSDLSPEQALGLPEAPSTRMWTFAPPRDEFVAGGLTAAAGAGLFTAGMMGRKRVTT